MLEEEIDPRRLIHEITENVVFHNTEDIIRMVNRLHELEFQVSMDDFGFGYSSLNVFRGMEIDEIKFGRKFLLLPEYRGKGEKIIRQMLSLSQNPGTVPVMECFFPRVPFLPGVFPEPFFQSG